MRARSFYLAILFGLVSGAASAADIPAYIAAAVADPARPAADTARDAQRHPAEIVAFAGVKPGDHVLELAPGGGYYTRILSRVVGPKGHVYALTPDEIVKAFPKAADGARAIAADAQYSNVTALVQPAYSMTLPHPIDIIWTTQNYHDMHIAKFYPTPNLLAFNKALFAALRPGGIYFISDHAAAPSSGMRDIELHRIDSDVVKSEVTAAGFTFDGESDILRNPDDPHTAMVFDPAIRGHTDQFILRFRRPAR